MKHPLLLVILAVWLCGCANQTDVKDPQPSSTSGPTLYGKVTGSVDQVWRP